MRYVSGLFFGLFLSTVVACGGSSAGLPSSDNGSDVAATGDSVSATETVNADMSSAWVVINDYRGSGAE